MPTLLLIISAALFFPYVFNRARRAAVWQTRPVVRAAIHWPEGCVVAGMACASLLLSILDFLHGEKADSPPALTAGTLFFLASIWLLLIAPALAVLFRGNASLPATFGIRRETARRDAMTGVRYGVAMIFPVWAATVATGLFFHSQGWPVEKQDALELLVNTDASAGLRAVFAVCAFTLVPVCEEAAFRGILLPALGRWRDAGRPPLCKRLPVSRWHVALAAQAALFSLVHFEAAALPGLFVVGVCLGLGYARTGSLLTPVVMHAVFNFVAVLAALAM